MLENVENEIESFIGFSLLPHQLSAGFSSQFHLSEAMLRCSVKPTFESVFYSN